MKHKLLEPLVRLFGKLERFFGGLQRRASYCPVCGSNLYYGEPCYGDEEGGDG